MGRALFIDKIRSSMFVLQVCITWNETVNKQMRKEQRPIKEEKHD